MNTSTRFPFVLTALLLGMWLTLNGELSLGQIVLGSVLSLALMFLIAGLRPVRPRVRRLYLAVPLIAAVVADIVRSNLLVTRIVIAALRGRRVQSGFIDVPLELTDPHALTMLAIIVTSTPGTSWAGLSADGTTLKLHLLDLTEEREAIRHIKERYEVPLMRIFG